MFSSTCFWNQRKSKMAQNFHFSEKGKLKSKVSFQSAAGGAAEGHRDPSYQVSNHQSSFLVSEIAAFNSSCTMRFLFEIWENSSLSPADNCTYSTSQSSETRGCLESFLEHLLSRVWEAQSDLQTNPAKFTLLPPTLARTLATVPCSHVWVRA